MNTQFAAGFDAGRGTYVFVETGGDVYHFTVEDIRKGVAQGDNVILSSGGSEYSRTYDSQLNTSFASADGEDFIDQLLNLFVEPTVPVSIDVANITGDIPVSLEQANAIVPVSIDEANVTGAVPVNIVGGGADETLLSAFLREGGVGTFNANGDYSLSQTNFSYAPAANEVARVKRIIGYISGPGFNDDRYGGIVLVNGVNFEYEQDSTTFDLLNTDVITSWQQWQQYCYDVNQLLSSGNDHAGFRWSFDRGAVDGIRLNGANGDEIRIILEDDFTSLVRHTFIIQGSIQTS